MLMIPPYSNYFVISYGLWATERSLCIAMEYLELGNLEKFFTSPMKEDDVIDITIQLSDGLSLMHECGFAHRELKPDVGIQRIQYLHIMILADLLNNILVVQNRSDEDGSRWWVKIGDFSISKRNVAGVTSLRTPVGTVAYMAPEVLGFFSLKELQLSQQKTSPSYTTAVDIWSLGVIVFRIITGEFPFPETIDLARYATLGAPFPIGPLMKAGAPEDCIDFLKRTMAPSAAMRPVAELLPYSPFCKPE